jgi:Tol biopolymer transport system component
MNQAAICAHVSIKTPVKTNRKKPMKTKFGTAAIAAMLTTALGAATNGNAAKPPPPPPPPYNPQILYTVTSKAGSTATITVSNADGTDVVSLYTSKNITGLNDVKFAPTGNQIVFSEQNDIKVLTYVVSSQGVTTTSVNTLASEPYTVLHVDVSPDGTQLLFVEHTADPNQWAVHAMSMNGGNRTPIQLMPAIYYDAVWAHSSSRIAVIQGGPVQPGYGVQNIQVIDLTTNGITTVFTSTNQLYQVSRLESAHTSDTLLFYATASGSNTGVYTVDIGTQIVTPIVAGWSPSFSSDDSMILFRGNATGDLFTLNISTNVQTQITSKVVLGRPDFLP